MTRFRKYALVLCLLLLGWSNRTIAQSSILDMHRRFLERLCAGYDQGKLGGKPFSAFLREEKVALLDGSFEELRSLCSDTSASMEVTVADGKRCAARLYRNDGQSVIISYPADYHVILDVSLMEMENSLYESVMDSSSVYPVDMVNVERTLLQPLDAGMAFIYKGDYFVLPALNNNRYYVREASGHFDLLYSEDYPIETMANLVTGTEIKTDITLSILFVKYGFRRDTLSVPLNRWVGFCLNEGCIPYYGVVSHQDDKVVAVLLMRNEDLGYVHVMKFSFDISILEKRCGEVTARLNSYVPFSNVKYLFSKDEK